MSVSEVVAPFPSYTIQVGRRDKSASRSKEKQIKELMMNYLQILLMNEFPLFWETIIRTLRKWGIYL